MVCPIRHQMERNDHFHNPSFFHRFTKKYHPISKIQNDANFDIHSSDACFYGNAIMLPSNWIYAFDDPRFTTMRRKLHFETWCQGSCWVMENKLREESSENGKNWEKASRREWRMKTEKMREWRMRELKNERRRRVIEVYLLHQTTFIFWMQWIRRFVFSVYSKSFQNLARMWSMMKYLRFQRIHQTFHTYFLSICFKEEVWSF